MKKRFVIMGIAFAIICSGLFTMGQINAATSNEITNEEIAAVWFENQHPEKTYDTIVIEDRGDNLNYVTFYENGVMVAMAYIDLEFYGELYF